MSDTVPRKRIAALVDAGRVSWAALGIIALVVVCGLALSAVSGILIPLVIAVILAIVLEPLVERLVRFGIPPAASALLAVLVGVVVGVATAAIVVVGVIQQWPEIYRQVLLGWRSLVSWLADFDLDPRWLDHLRTAVEGQAADVANGVAGAVASTFYGAISAVLGAFFALFFLFFVLRDSARFPGWVSQVTRLDLAEVETVADLTRQSLRGYFRGTAITALLTAPIFMVPLLIFRVPLAIPIFVLYFFLSFLPFVGAWITGIFVVLVALGSSGPTAAIVLAVTFVISNGTIQSAVSSWALGSSLKLHPMAVLLATMIGGTIAGILGMVLGAPILAAVTKSVTAIRAMRAGPEPPVPGDSR